MVIVGGSSSGLAAALTARAHYPNKEILVVRKEERALVPCGIPYIFGTLGSFSKNLIADQVLSKQNIQLKVSEVKSLDRAEKKILTSDGETVGYDKLILATGSVPYSPPVQGSEKKNIFLIRKEIPYLQGLMSTIDRIQDLVIVGGGFIGIEFASECRKKRGLNVSLVEVLPHCLMGSGLDEEFCVEVERALSEIGVRIFTGRGVESFEGKTGVEKVKLTDGKELRTDAVLIAVGLKPEVRLAEKAGLELGRTGGIKVDRYMRTSDPNIFACGDCVEKSSFFTGKPVKLMLASVGALEARIAGANLFEIKRENPGEIGVFSTTVNEIVFASAGLSERAARESGYRAVVGEAIASSKHPRTMPNVAETKMKLIFDSSTGTILGGQFRGGMDTGELINVVSACILNRMTANDIARFQMGTHPALTSSPVTYPLVNAAEDAIKKMG